MKIRQIFLILLIGTVTQLWADEPRQLAILIFIDQTLTDSQEVALWQEDLYAYLDRLRNGVNGVRKIYIRYQPIHAFTKTSAPISAKDFSGRKEIKHRMDREKKIKEIRTALKTIYPVPKEHGEIITQSDILSSIDLAIEFFEAHNKARKELHYYSDMIQFYSDMKLLSDKKFLSNQLDALADELIRRYTWSKQGLPDVRINITKPATRYGAKTSKKLTAAMVGKIDRFWRILFARLGAKVEAIDTI